MLLLAMAVVRSKSCGDVDFGGPNPFWSRRTSAEWRLAQARPDHLLPPVPGSDEEGEVGVDDSCRGRSRSRHGEAHHGEPSGMVFTTPPSWSMDIPQGEMRAKGKGGVRPGSQTEGLMSFEEEGEEHVAWSTSHVDDLQRSLEEEVVRKLHEENVRLKAEVQRLQVEQHPSTASWSEVSEVPPPPPRSVWDEVRYTPNGTRIPSGPPPSAGECEELWQKLPKWPLDEYETVADLRPCGATLGMCGMPVSGNLHDRSDGRGMHSRHDRALYSQVPGGGIQSRHGHQEGKEDVMTAAQAKAVWLERELASLQQVLNRECSSQVLRGEYWSAPTKRWNEEALYPEGDHGDGRARGDRAGIGSFAVGDGRARGDRAGIGSFAVGDGRARGDRAGMVDFEAGDVRARGDRAGMGNFEVGDCRARGDRAEHLHQADLLGDRVLHPHQANPRDDRAWQLHHGGAGRDQVNGEVGAGLERTTESSTSATGVGGSQDQGGNHRTVELPELSGGDLTPLILGDWLEVVKPLMMDLSPQASRWWVLVVEEAYKYYHEWRKATPMERLKIVPESEMVKKDLTLHRTEQRGISLLLKAIPTTVKETVIAERLMTTTGILFTLLKNFQPGGSSERTMLLKELSEIKVGKSPGEACAGVRSWRRFYTRTKEIDATVPDPIILLKALEPAVQLISQLDAQATFRLAQSRAQLQVDARPDESSVWSYSECLLAELESLRLVHGASTMSNGGAISTTTPAVKTLGTRSTTTAACKFWGSEAGCKQGKACKFEHASLDDARDRCWNCSSTTHRKASCPYKTGGMSGDSSNPGQGPPGGSGKGGKSKTNPGGAPGGKSGKTSEKQSSGKPMINKAQATEDKGKGTASSAASATSTTSAQEQPKEENDKDDAMRSQSSTSQQGQRNTTARSGEMNSESLVSEVTALLRSMRMQGPRLSAISIKRLERNLSKTTLLDGGATHCLRPTTSQQEWDAAQECTVALATGSVELKQVRDSGTLITQDRSTQRIIPIRELVRMGLKIVWKNETIEMTWQDGSRLPVWLDDGCPVVDDKLGQQLMEQIEANNFRLAGMKKIWKYGNREAGEKQCDKESVDDAVELSRLFPEVPHWLIGRIPGASSVDMSKVPFNRRQRKRLMEATTRVLHLFSGEHTRTWMEMAEEGLAVVCVEIEQGTDFLDDNLYAFLLDMAKDGLWDLITGGPPCRTVSLQRYREDGGPRPLRSRAGMQRFGLSWNSLRQQEQCDQDSVLWLRMLFLIYCGWKGNPKLETLVEQPSDPEIWLSSERPRPVTGFASYLCWPETEALQDILCLHSVSFDQGAVGHEHVKPTTLLTSCQETFELRGLRADQREAVQWSPDLHQRLEESKKAAKWAPGIVDVIKRAIRRIKEASVFGPRPGQIRRNPGKFDAFLDKRRELREKHGLPPLPDERLAIRTMDVKQKRELLEWQHHLDNDHRPFRRDCEECLRSMGRDRMRKRVVCPDSYVLNLDIMGPFNAGDDQTGSGFHYAMIGAFTVPCSSDDNPLVQGLLQMGGRVRHQEDEDAGEGGQQREDLTVRRQLEIQLKEMTEQHAKRPVREQQSAEENIFDEEVQPAQEVGQQQEGQEPIPGESDFDEMKQLEDFLKELDARDSPPTEIEVQAWDAMNRQWQDKIAHLKNVKVKTLTMAIPMKSRHTQEVLRAMALMHARLRSLNLPLIRCHTDRAREFIARPVQDWLRSHQVVQTVAAGAQEGWSEKFYTSRR